MSDLFKNVYFKSLSHNLIIIKPHCHMEWVYEIKLPEALTWRRYFFAMIKIKTYEGNLPLTMQAITVQPLKHAGNICNCFDH